VDEADDPRAARAPPSTCAATTVWQCRKVLARCKQVMRQLTEMWSVLETLTPSEYMEFRDVLGPSSGFQSLQYRTIEFLLGNKNAQMLKVFAHDESRPCRAEGRAGVAEPVRRIPALPHALGTRRPGDAARARLVEAAYIRQRAGTGVRSASTRTPPRIGANNALCEDLVDVETQFQLWRFRHHAHGAAHHRLQTRAPGDPRAWRFLKQALELTFFPELFEVRTSIGPGASYGSPPDAPAA
jgi:tryptophan 2,3-dioxygenase